jgi:hypothetical protein
MYKLMAKFDERLAVKVNFKFILTRANMASSASGRAE